MTESIIARKVESNTVSNPNQEPIITRLPEWPVLGFVKKIVRAYTPGTEGDYAVAVIEYQREDRSLQAWITPKPEQSFEKGEAVLINRSTREVDNGGAVVEYSLAKPIVVQITTEESGIHITSSCLDLDFYLPVPCYRADTVRNSLELQAGQPLFFVEENKSRNHK